MIRIESNEATAVRHLKTGERYHSEGQPSRDAEEKLHVDPEGEASSRVGHRLPFGVATLSRQRPTTILRTAATPPIVIGASLSRRRFRGQTGGYANGAETCWPQFSPELVKERNSENHPVTNWIRLAPASPSSRRWNTTNRPSGPTS